MNKFSKCIFTILFVVSCHWVAAQQPGSSVIKGTEKKATEIIKEVKRKKAYLVDVRTPEEFNAGHLKYAKNIDFKSAEFKNEISKLKKKKTVYLYCRSGNRSGKALDTLKALGFNKPYNIGGFVDLVAAGLPGDTIKKK
jgi:rhodanese-related sulfurtransferase